MTWVQTFSGKRFDLLNPRIEDVCIEDIAHALANICRFNGHCREFYSVGQHSVHCADIVSEPYKIDALLHDAGEAYYGDITRPQKIVYRDMTLVLTRCGEWSGFDSFTRCIDKEIAAALHLSDPMPDLVYHADNIMLATEARDLMGPPPEPWPKLPAPLPHTVRPWPRDEVFSQFMRIYEECRHEAED